MQAPAQSVPVAPRVAHKEIEQQLAAASQLTFLLETLPSSFINLEGSVHRRPPARPQDFKKLRWQRSAGSACTQAEPIRPATFRRL